MHGYMQTRENGLSQVTRRTSPHFVRIWLTACLLLLTTATCLLTPGLALARSAITTGGAPGGPGSTAVWSPSTNAILGTSATTASDVWFSGYNGIISEVYWPTADTPNTTDMQFMIGDSSHTWVDEEKAATTSSTALYDPHSLAWTVTNTATNGKYKLAKTIYTDPTRDSLIQQVTFTALSGTLSNYLLYVLYNPTIHNNGMNNNSSTQTYNGTTMLVSTDSSGNYASALAASIPYQSGMTSSGYVGVNDGWTDLKGTSNCGGSSCPDYTMDYGYSSASNGNTAQMGLFDLSNDGTVNTSTATSLTFTMVLSFGSGMTAAEQTLAGTLGDTSDMLSTYVSQWNAFDNSLRTPPAVGSTTAIQQARAQEYYLAANVVKSAQDKQTGAFVAGLGTPWGDTQAVSNDPQGYHVVWERDMYEFASALIVAGDTADPTRAVHWAFNTQQQSDGHFPQNTYVNGNVVWGGIQEDEQAFPIMLAWKLGVTDSSDYTNHILPAAKYIVNHGPSTGQERWEENGGYSPSTIAAEIAGLICAASIATANGDTANASLFTSTADSWRSQVVGWTYTTSGSLSGGSYFERIDNNGNPNDGGTINISNGGGSYDERNVVDSSFLELVRQGIFPATDSHITTSLATIDATIKETINGHDYFFRYNHDGYGETSSGANYTGAGIGRLWPILSGERGIYTVADGGSGDAALSAMTAAANSSGFIPEQIWDNSAPSGDTPGTPTKSMTPLNWAMGEYITLLFSSAENCIADVASVVYTHYIGSSPSCSGSTGTPTPTPTATTTPTPTPTATGTPAPAGVSIAPNPALAGQSATITYNGTLASAATSMTMHWGYNSWTAITDTAMTRQSDGSWTATISVLGGATTLNTAFHNQNTVWDNNGGSNYNFTVTTATPTPTPTATSTPTPTPTVTPTGGTTCSVGSASSSTCPLVAGSSATIVYSGSLAASASSLTLHWGYNGWTSTTDTVMTKQSNGTWSASILVPSGATVINTAYKNQSSSWDNNGGSNYNLPVGACFIKTVSTASCPTVPGASITIVYSGSLAASASSLTMHWSYDSWNGLVVDTPMSKQSNGTWTATITVPSAATTLNMAFKNQSSTWDSNGGSNYNLNT